jgi:hypothetical protein
MPIGRNLGLSHDALRLFETPRTIPPAQVTTKETPAKPIATERN